MKKLIIAVTLCVFLFGCSSSIDQKTQFNKYSGCCDEMWYVMTDVYGYKGTDYFLQKHYIKSVKKTEIEDEKKRQYKLAERDLELLINCQTN